MARALLHRGWRVRALVRDPFSAGAAALAARGAELVVGTFEDRAAMRSAMAGVDGVFSVQPSSPGGTVTDEQEVRYGITIADLAVECGVKHLVYSSGSATGECEELIYLIPAKYPGLSGNKSKQLGIFRSLRVGIEKNEATFYLIPYLWIT